MPTCPSHDEVDSNFHGSGRACLQGVRSALAGAHPDHRLDRDGPHLPVADPSGLRALGDDVDNRVGVVVLDGAPTQIGVARAVEFDFTSGEMTITTRTTDTPAGAVNLLTGTINALTGTVNNL